MKRVCIKFGDDAMQRARFALRTLVRLRCTLPSSASSSSVARRDPHAVLGVLREDVTPQLVRSAYLKLALEGRRAAPARLAELGAAHDALLGKAPETEPEPAWVPAGPTPQSAALLPAPFRRAYPRWAHRWQAYLHRLPAMLDLWLEPSWASIIYQALRNGRLHEALDMFDEMRADGESPSHATYEMLIRGCAIGMRRVGPGEAPDHLTRRLLAQVLALFTDMQEAGRKPDYLTHIELVRALGKAGAVDEAMGVFEKMCRTVWLLPEERALNSMYELCVLSGHHAYALRVFDEHEELRKSLWRPRYTPVSFSLLLTACAEPGPDAEERLAKLPRVLELMGRHGVLPRAATCERLLGACDAAGAPQIAEQVRSIASRGGHELPPPPEARRLEEGERSS